MSAFPLPPARSRFWHAQFRHIKAFADKSDRIHAAASGFFVLHLVTGRSSFEVTSFHCLAAGILTTLIAMGTGLFYRWVNYMARPVRQVTIRIVLSCIMLSGAAGVLIWRLWDASVARGLQASGVIYLVVIPALAPLSRAIGYFGVTLTFPAREEVEPKRSSWSPNAFTIDLRIMPAPLGDYRVCRTRCLITSPMLMHTTPHNTSQRS